MVPRDYTITTVTSLGLSQAVDYDINEVYATKALYYQKGQ